MLNFKFPSKKSVSSYFHHRGGNMRLQKFQTLEFFFFFCRSLKLFSSTSVKDRYSHLITFSIWNLMLSYFWLRLFWYNKIIENSVQHWRSICRCKKVSEEWDFLELALCISIPLDDRRNVLRDFFGKNSMIIFRPFSIQLTVSAIFSFLTFLIWIRYNQQESVLQRGKLSGLYSSRAISRY